MKTILCVHPLLEENKQRIQEAAAGHRVIFAHEQEEFLLHVDKADALIGWRGILNDNIHANTNLKWVQVYSAGVNNIPFEQFIAKNIILTNSSGIHANPISETLFAMMLSLTRYVHTAILHQPKKKWGRDAIPFSMGEMHGKTMGIIGVGAIGEETARLAKAFNMTVLGVRRSNKASSYVDEMYTFEQWEDEVLPRCDYIVVTLPLTPQTHHFIGAQQFAKMKPSAYYFNIGRGQTTDEAALTQALQSGTIAGAGLDVFEVEPLPETSPLWELENVIILPHISGSSDQYQARFMEILLTNLKDFLAGELPSVNRVDLHNQY